MKNYGTHKGVLFQKVVKPTFKNYAETYNTYGELGKYMSYLRFGNIVGALGRLPTSLLDVGYGNGDFLRTCIDTGVKSYGYDISEYPLPEGAEAGDIYGEYDVITFYDSLEHFTNIEFLYDLKCNYLVISVPECHYPENEEWFMNWKHRRPDEHLWHFNRNTLQGFLSGYELISQSSIEDVIRKNPSQPENNILTAVYKCS